VSRFEQRQVLGSALDQVVVVYHVTAVELYGHNLPEAKRTENVQ
jgi:hypothetical protein